MAANPWSQSPSGGALAGKAGRTLPAKSGGGGLRAPAQTTAPLTTARSSSRPAFMTSQLRPAPAKQSVTTLTPPLATSAPASRPVLLVKGPPPRQPMSVAQTTKTPPPAVGRGPLSLTARPAPTATKPAASLAILGVKSTFAPPGQPPPSLAMTAVDALKAAVPEAAALIDAGMQAATPTTSNLTGDALPAPVPVARGAAPAPLLAPPELEGIDWKQLGLIVGALFLLVLLVR